MDRASERPCHATTGLPQNAQNFRFAIQASIDYTSNQMHWSRLSHFSSPVTLCAPHFAFLPRAPEGGYGLTAPFLDPARQPTGPQAGGVLGAESKTLERQLQRPGVRASRFKCRDLLPVETLEFLKLLDASVVLKGIQPQRPVSSQDAELNLRRVGRKARIQGAAEEVRAGMLLAVPLHATPTAAPVHGSALGNDV